MRAWVTVAILLSGCFDEAHASEPRFSEDANSFSDADNELLDALVNRTDEFLKTVEPD